MRYDPRKLARLNGAQMKWQDCPGWGERTLVMGIINATPDSFSGDGVEAVRDAVAQAERAVAQSKAQLLEKEHRAEVAEKTAQEAQLELLRRGCMLNDGLTRAEEVEVIERWTIAPPPPERSPAPSPLPPVARPTPPPSAA